MLKCNKKGAELDYQRVTTFARAGCDASLSGCQLTFQSMHSRQNRRDNVFIADRCVNHHVIQTAGRPVGVEVMFHKGDAILVDRVQHFFGFAVATAEGSTPATLAISSVS